MEKIENILTNCIQEIKSEKATLAECLDRYPSRRRELEPLLRMALNIQQPPSFQLDNNYKQASRAQLLQQISASKQKKSRSFSDIFSFGLAPQLAWARVAISVLIVVIFISTLAGGTAYAAQSSMPGDILYPVKIGTENLRLFMAGKSSDKVELNLKFAQRRLIELSKLASIDKQKAESALNSYEGNLNAAWQQISKITDASSQANMLGIALRDIQNQVDFCDEIIDTGPAYTTMGSQASNLAINEQLEFLQMLELYNNLPTAQINLDAMQNRLQRAQLKANINQYQLMQEALLQYQKFNQLGEQILQNAQITDNNSIEIEELSLQALSGYLDILNNIYQQVPQEYRNSIEVCRQLTLQFQTQARNRYQKQGSPDMNQEGLSPGDGSSSPSEQSNPSGPQYQDGTENPSNEAPNNTINPPQDPGISPGNGSGTGSGSGTDSGGDGTIPPDETTGSSSGQLYQYNRLVGISVVAS